MRKIVYIEWVDALSEDNWYSEEDIDEWLKNGEESCRSIGWVVKENKKYIVIASLIGKEDTDSVSLLMKIPKPLIKKIKIIKL